MSKIVDNIEDEDIGIPEKYLTEENRDEDRLFLEEEEEDETPNNEEGTEDTGEDDDFEIPEKFRGKSQKDVIKAYRELERKLGQQSQDIGELRKLVDQRVKESFKPKEPEPEVDISFDDIADDPSSAIDRRVTPKIRQLEERLEQQAQQARVEKFLQNHPDHEEIGQDKDFQEWVNASSYRSRLFSQAQTQMDIDAAEELLVNWKERQEFMKERHKEVKDTVDSKRKKAMKSATSESGSTGGSSRKVWSRVEIMKLMQDDPERYFALSPQIEKAYLEGRVK